METTTVNEVIQAFQQISNNYGNLPVMINEEFLPVRAISVTKVEFDDGSIENVAMLHTDVICEETLN